MDEGTLVETQFKLCYGALNCVSLWCVDLCFDQRSFIHIIPWLLVTFPFMFSPVLLRNHHFADF